jgi:hypothetical protein
MSLLPIRGADTPIAGARAVADHGVVLALATEPLARLAGDVGAAARLLPDDDPLRAYLEMAAALGGCEEAWREALEPWVDDARHGLGPRAGSPGRVAAAGALGVAALRTARDLPAGSPLAPTLLALARWMYFTVGAGVR